MSLGRCVVAHQPPPPRGVWSVCAAAPHHHPARERERERTPRHTGAGLRSTYAQLHCNPISPIPARAAGSQSRKMAPATDRRRRACVVLLHPFPPLALCAEVLRNITPWGLPPPHTTPIRHPACLRCHSRGKTPCWTRATRSRGVRMREVVGVKPDAAQVIFWQTGQVTGAQHTMQ